MSSAEKENISTKCREKSGEKRAQQKTKSPVKEASSDSESHQGGEIVPHGSADSKQGKKRQQPFDQVKETESPAKKIKLEKDGNVNKSDHQSEASPSQSVEKKKAHRKRMKHTLSLVLEQMEFYFGDSTLSKDRFLRALVDSSPEGYVDLCVFANFNKLQALHKDGISRDVLIQALGRSSVLELNKEKTAVRRVTPLKEISQEETDRRTVYVEHLPSHATHMWIKQVFSQCGKVVYVSLPTYRTSKQIKGFAFVEFATPEDADRACSMLNNPEPEKAMEPPGKFPKGNKTLDRLKKVAPLLPAKETEENKSDAQEIKDTAEDQSASADVDSKKKKNKKSKKKKTQDGTSVTSGAEDAEMANTSAGKTSTPVDQKASEAKKKKKKRKRKNSQTLEQSTEAVEETISEGAASKNDASVRCQEGRSEQQEVSSEVPQEGQQEGSDAAQDKDKSQGESKDGESSQQQIGKSSEENVTADPDTSTLNKKKKKKKKKTKADNVLTSSDKPESKEQLEESHSVSAPTDNKGNAVDTASHRNDGKAMDTSSKVSHSTPLQDPERRLSHKERKLLRQEDIRRKRQQRLEQEGKQNVEMEDSEAKTSTEPASSSGVDTANASTSEDLMKTEGGQQPTSILKMKKKAEKKRVEFDPVPITTEFVEAKGARKRKKQKREKCHLRVISKKEWSSLKQEYINQQKSHMQALKESLRELRQQEAAASGRPTHKKSERMDLEDVFGTKPLKLTQEQKMANVEMMKFTPNVIVQWWCTHEMHRDKIRTMFKETHAESIAYIDASEEARSGYIRFKDENSAEEFAKMSRNSTSFMARVLPAEQQEEYWEKANRDRLQKLGRKKKEKGSDKIARKVFERNKATFSNKPTAGSRIVFADVEEEEESSGKSNASEEVKTAQAV